MLGLVIMHSCYSKPADLAEYFHLKEAQGTCLQLGRVTEILRIVCMENSYNPMKCQLKLGDKVP